VEKRCGDTVLNCNERGGHCSSLQWWPTAMQSGCLGKSIAVQCTAMSFTPLRLLCSRPRLQGSYAPASAIAFCPGRGSCLKARRYALGRALPGVSAMRLGAAVAPRWPRRRRLRWLRRQHAATLFPLRPPRIRGAEREVAHMGPKKSRAR
jgi:hypothetical protein